MSTFDCLRTYNDMCKEIEALTIRRDELASELHILNRRIMNAGPRTKLVASYLGMPGGGPGEMPLVQQWEVFNAVQEALEDVNDILSLKLEAKKRMEVSMSTFDRIEYKVAYLRDIERKPLYEIAKDLGYTYEYVRQISSRVKRVKNVTINAQSA